MKLLDGVRASASMSDDGTYRYRLDRKWGFGEGLALWVMLNPSTATAEEDDPTIRRCQSFSSAWGYSGIVVANLFGLRSTDPAALRTHPEPVGPQNDDWIRCLFGDPAVRMVVAAWGTHGSIRRRDAAVIVLAQQTKTVLHALDITKAGHPKHPLYVRADTLPVVYRTPGTFR